ncbi:helicase-related protein [Actinokineospora sp. UTMC 2448]|uniref:helicase-related protein n=1 Tax=Actinokineospora sp. UTMC 2448 TaxID=2268449 RepID=UPI002164E349|nr:helicase-related protein [Actinokineospora sp. UTMC 2448]UVS78195.1 RNA polymerase-associated protein RapA [Actinokineospora sp. UTMC 2448]
MRLEDLVSGVRVVGVVPGEPVAVIAAQWHGRDAVELTYKSSDGGLHQRVLFRSDESALTPSSTGSRPFDADAQEFRLVAEAQRIRYAGLSDPMLAVATSEVRPLPHQIRAVYGEMLDRTPLRFLLADDPGAGKTIMAGLYIKELLLRDDVKRCLVVVPGGLVEQWQDELFFKFGLRFEILSRSMADASLGAGVFERYPLLIARMDQLARSTELRSQLEETEFDLVVVDEAHRMGAHYFGERVDKTKRFQLGETLRDRTRHLLLMTATPHAGKADDFQLFLTLLDRDGFAGRARPGANPPDTKGFMRRMVKEDLLTFEGKPLFPERIAQTVPYELTAREQDLYERVTEYVREGMNRAERLGDTRRNTVGFALTVLQRRLASSPEAIHQSLVRRVDRLRRRRDDLAKGRSVSPDPTIDPASWDDDEHNAAEIEQLEDELLDAATAARTIAELDTELAELDRLVSVARQVRNLDSDRKWVELRRILADNDLIHPDAAELRKLIIFTEHRDTLNYLVRKIRSLYGTSEAVQAIHGGVARGKRREITEEFTTNPACRVLLATDAAGEGLNLQAAHLVVNYDLPWNPNRIEQRFGRVHRIGQTEVCRLWNLVATNTREGEVFTKLLAKIDEQRKAYGGKVFDVLGAAFDETPLRDLLIEAIRYGDHPETRARMAQVIDESVAHGLKELLEERALTHDALSDTDLRRMRRQMEEAQARRLQPHYVEWVFRHAFQRLGGRLVRRERGRYEITLVPAGVRAVAKYGPIASQYERVVFDIDRVNDDTKPRPQLLAPGHPLLDAVIDLTITQLNHVLERGTVLVSAEVSKPRLLVGLVEEAVDGAGESIAKRFGYAHVDSTGKVTPAGPAPYLDCVTTPETKAVASAKGLPWLPEAETQARSWIINNRLQDYLAEVAPRRVAEIERLRAHVDERLASEAERLTQEARRVGLREAAGAQVRESAESLRRKAQDLLVRRAHRLALLDQQVQLSGKPPRIMTAALVLPLASVQDALPSDAPIRAVETKAVEQRGVDLVLAVERNLGRTPQPQAFTNPGYDVLSVPPDDGPSIRIEVKARLEGATDFYVTHNEVVTAKNASPDYRLALVTVSAAGPDHDQVRYLAMPFTNVEFGDLAATGVRIDWAKTWAAGTAPF